MSQSAFDEIRLSIGFSEQDAANVRFLAYYTAPGIPEIAHRLREQLLKDEEARALFARGERDVSRLDGLLSTWLRELFEVRYDEAYWDRRRRIGDANARIGLPQHHVFAAMELTWEDLERRIHGLGIPDARDKLRSLHKLLMLELAVMLESYTESYSEQVRRTERRAVEEKLTRAEHLAEIGQLAASLAHEIKNPLAGISGAIQIIRGAMTPNDAHHSVLSEILGQINRLDATVKDLLQYARPTPPKATEVTLDKVVERVLTVLREEPALQRVKIQCNPVRTDTVVNADDAQIEQLLINLILNAAHASADG